jgi:3-oxoacyl-[acyl-carrier protein] reductase
LADEGCHLGICGRDSANLDEAAARLMRRGVKVTGIQADVSLEDEAVHLVKEMGRFFGEIDILINNVGGALGSPALLETSNDDWQKTFELNVFQVARMIRLVVPLMNKKEGGSIVNIASISGWQPQLSGSTQLRAP